MAGALTIFFVIVRVIFLPIVACVNLVLYLLSPIWTLGTFILLPLLHFSHAIITILTFPFRMHLLDRIEVCNNMPSFTLPTSLASTRKIQSKNKAAL